MNLGDPELELIDPTPNVHALFLQFDKMFFCTKLHSRAIVKWSKRMYSCAGICSYEGRGGLCVIALSEPLLKLRSRKDIIETLLHEMIHAYLFVTNGNQDRDGHGPNFKEHMYKINYSAGLNITIYHSFHDEVKLYQTHWWRCDGPCQNQRPYFGTVRRPVNRAPGPSDRWWNWHRRNCGGNFIKIKEPEKKEKKKASQSNSKSDITKYITTGKGYSPNNKPVLKDSNSIPIKTATKSNSHHLITTIDITKEDPTKPPFLFSGQGQTINNGKPTNSFDIVNTLKNVWTNNLPNTNDVVNTVRNVWTNRQITGTLNSITQKGKELVRTSTNEVGDSVNSRKQKSEHEHINSPPAKIKKIDDYFKKTATSILKDVYGEDFALTQKGEDKKFVAVLNKSNSVNKDENKIVVTNTDVVGCPVCRAQVSSSEINNHLDECLNKEVISGLSSDSVQPSIPMISDQNSDPYFVKPYNKVEIGFNNQKFYVKNGADNCKNNGETCRNLNKSIATNSTEIQSKSSGNTRRSDSFIVPEKKQSLPTSLDYLSYETATKIKTEPVTSKYLDIIHQKCACCGKIIDKQINEHLDECLAFIDNNNTIPEEASTNLSYETIVIDDDDDVFDETMSLNVTGTKFPCPCCLEMIEEADMNNHLDSCLS